MINRDFVFLYQELKHVRMIWISFFIIIKFYGKNIKMLFFDIINLLYSKMICDNEETTTRI